MFSIDDCRHVLAGHNQTPDALTLAPLPATRQVCRLPEIAGDEHRQATLKGVTNLSKLFAQKLHVAH
jgi:hypothetical protein